MAASNVGKYGIVYPKGGDPYDLVNDMGLMVASIAQALDGFAPRTHSHLAGEVTGSSSAVPVFPTGWQNYGGGFATMAYTRLNSALAVATGVITAPAALSAGAFSETAATSPVVAGDCRPASTSLYHCIGTSGGRIMLYTYPDGHIRIHRFTAVAAGEYFMLSNVYSLK